MDTKKKIKKVCPFWSPEEHACKILAEGLFIPLEDHIEMYCKSQEHYLCRQYILNEHAQGKTVSADLTGRERDRRQSPRITSNHRLTFIRLSDSGHAASLNPLSASTLDLSANGMRLSTRELLLHDSIIQFQFTAPPASSLQTGLAKVKWCKPTRHNLRYQAGLSFQSDQFVQAVGEYLVSHA